MKTNISRPNRTRIFISLFIVAGLLIGAVAAPLVRADRFQSEINRLQAENAQKAERLRSLEVEADSLQAMVQALQRRIDGLQKQISANQAKNEELKIKIAEAEEELAKQRKLLGENIKAMYLEGDISTLEMLASSKDLSEFMDKQQYRNTVKDKIRSTLDRINELRAQLKSQKDEVERLIKEQQILRDEVATQQAEQRRLLGMNRQQQNAFNRQIRQNKEEIAELKRQQVLENLRLFGSGTQPGIPGGGGYPWGNAYCVHTGRVDGPCYNYDWYFNGSPWDAWGYGFRNCTSWVAYKLATEGKSGFTYLGNANQWPGRAAARGIPVTYGHGARAGNAAVNPNGFYGHVMYVEAVLSDGRVVVSDYNRAGDGLYRGPEGGSAAVISQSSLVFIHF
jgi:peptidoglycan DL-endopeptidase CwlO